MRASSLYIPKFALGLAAMVFSFSPPITANTLYPCQADLQAPSDLSLNLSIKNGQTVFRQGEIITLVAKYSSAVEGKYLWDNQSYDRSGRLEGFEDFCLSPAVGVDPLRDYYSAQLGRLGGGLFSEVSLGPLSQVIERDLNEWESLPLGWYSISVVGARVSLARESGSENSPQKTIPLKSNTVNFQVIEADPTWQSLQLSGAIQTLNTGNITSDQRTRAARIIRFLGTEQSTRECVHRFASTPDDKSPWEFIAGIWASSYRQDAIREMKASIEDFNGNINRNFVRSLVQLEIASDPRTRFSPNCRTSEECTRTANAYAAEMDRRINSYVVQYGLPK